MRTSRAEEREAPTDGCCARKLASALTLPGTPCQQFLQHPYRCMSHKETVDDHGARSQALFELYDIFYECAGLLRNSFESGRQAIRAGGWEECALTPQGIFWRRQERSLAMARSWRLGRPLAVSFRRHFLLVTSSLWTSCRNLGPELRTEVGKRSGSVHGCSTESKAAFDTKLRHPFGYNARVGQAGVSRSVVGHSHRQFRLMLIPLWGPKSKARSS
jgi:hypothetical protein